MCTTTDVATAAARCSHPSPTNNASPSEPPDRLEHLSATLHDLGGSPHSSYKEELITTRPWPTLARLRVAVFDYIEGWYNTRRVAPGLL
jgi:Integrase core domain